MGDMTEDVLLRLPALKEEPSLVLFCTLLLPPRVSPGMYMGWLEGCIDKRREGRTERDGRREEREEFWMNGCLY
jgi:hypothetical protein